MTGNSGDNQTPQPVDTTSKGEGGVTDVIKILPKYARLSGSRARGDYTRDSDWDFHIPEKHWDEFKRWCLDNLGMFESNITGHIFYYVGQRIHSNLIEFSTMFPVIRPKKGNSK